MDLYEQRLKRLEADYEETIVAGTRAEQRRQIERAVAERREQYKLLNEYNEDAESCAIETPVIESRESDMQHEPFVAESRVIKPLTAEELDKIRTHMATINLKHVPSWASQVGDDQLVAMMRRIASDSQ
jgi:hypothetical protein